MRIIKIGLAVVMLIQLLILIYSGLSIVAMATGVCFVAFGGLTFIELHAERNKASTNGYNRGYSAAMHKKYGTKVGR